MIHAVFLSLTLAAAAATANPIAAHIAAVQKVIDAGNVQYVATWRRGDAKAFAALYAENAATIGEDGSITRGRANIEAAQAQSNRRTRLLKASIKTVDLVVDGGTAYEMGTYSFTFAPVKSGKAVDYHGRYLTIWTQQPDGSWKITTDAGLPNRPCTTTS